MKRYRVVGFDYDTRATLLDHHVQENDISPAAMTMRNAKAQLLRELQSEFGTARFDQKLCNLSELGPLPFSVVAFHNKFLRQIRNAFITCSYYPALTGACALGERILNHLLRQLRDYYAHTSDYKDIYAKESFDDWGRAILVLVRWEVFRGEVEENFRALHKLRIASLHFRPEVDEDSKSPALKAIKLLQSIIESRFGIGQNCEGLLHDIPGEVYIASSFEKTPFIQTVYIPNCYEVGPYHIVEKIVPTWVIKDEFSYERRTIDDQEFVRLRMNFLQHHQNELVKEDRNISNTVSSTND